MTAIRPPEIIRTERLLLRPVLSNDAGPIFRTYAGEENPTRFMNFARHRDMAETQVFADRCARSWDAGSAFPWAIVNAGSDEFMGVIELRPEPPKAEFGYILGEHFWGNGYATEAARAIAAWTIAEPAIFRIWATCHPDNVASARVLTKAGFVYETTLVNWEARPQLGEDAGPSKAYVRLA